MTKKLERQDLRLMAYTEAHRPGGDPSLLLELLADALVDEHWKSYTDDNNLPFQSEYDFLTRDYPQGIGLNEETLSILRVARHRYELIDRTIQRRMARLRIKLSSFGKVRDAPGNPHENDFNFDISKLNINETTGGGTSKAYRIARLKRDAPDIAERVIDGELSAAAGMRELDKRNGKPEELRRAVNMLSAASTLETLLKYMPEDVLLELTDLLIEWRNETHEDKP